MPRTSGGAAGGGGGGTPPGAFAIIYAQVNIGGSVPQQVQVLDQPYLTSNPNITSGIMLSASSLPSLIGASSVVCPVADFAADVAGVDTTTDDLILTGVITVADQLGTNAISVAGSVDIAKVGPGQSGGVDFSMADATAIVGTDLSWDTATGISTTAGGIFSVSIEITAIWD